MVTLTPPVTPGGMRTRVQAEVHLALPASPSRLYGISLRVITPTDTGRYSFSYTARMRQGAGSSLTHSRRSVRRTHVTAAVIKRAAARRFFRSQRLTALLVGPVTGMRLEAQGFHGFCKISVRPQPVTGARGASRRDYASTSRRTLLHHVRERVLVCTHT